MNMSGRQEQRQPLDVTTTSAMEPIPDCEEVTMCNETVNPGWIYCESSKKGVPTSDAGSIEIEKSTQYKVDCYTGEALPMLRDKEVFQNSPWVKELHSFNSNKIICVTGTKIVSRKVKNVVCHGKPVITEVKNYAQTLMSIVCSQNVNAEIASDLQQALEHKLNGNNNPDIMFKLNFIFDRAFLYSNSRNVPLETNLEAIEKFCSCVTESTVDLHVSTAVVTKPKVSCSQEVNYQKDKLEGNTMENTKNHESISVSKQPHLKLLIETKVTGIENNITEEVLQGNMPTIGSHIQTTHSSVNCASQLESKFDGTSEFGCQEITFTTDLKINTELHTQEGYRNKDTLGGNYCKYPQKEGSSRGEGCSGKLGDHTKKKMFASSCIETTYAHCKQNMDLGITAASGSFMARKSSQLIPEPESSSTMSVADYILEDCKNAISKGNKQVISDQTSLGVKQKIPCTNLSGDLKKNSPEQQLTNATETKSGGIYEECGSNVKCNSGKYGKSSWPVYEVWRDLERPATVVDNDHASPRDKNCIAEVNSSSQSKEKLMKDYPAAMITEHPLADLTSFEATRMIKFSDLKPFKDSIELSGFRRKYFGISSLQKREKVILLIGSVGSGKTTLINFLANFLKGVKITDENILLVEKAQNKEDIHTTSMTAYTFCFKEGDTPITLIDTPGLSDDTGMEARDKITVLKTFLARKDIQLHAIGYVISANFVRLASSECLIFEYLVTQFGEGISKNFVTFLTFADIQGTPPVVDILKEYNVKGNLVLKFNNSIFSIKECQMNDLDKAFWKAGVKSWKKCLKFLDGLDPLTINSFKAKQSQTFLSSQMNSVEIKLRNKLKSYMLLFKESKKLTEDLQESAEQVWSLTSVLYHLKSKKESSVSDIESLLVAIADEVAKEISFPSKHCVMLLSLSPSRGVLETGKRVIKCLAPIYDKAKASSVRKDSPVRKKPSILYCTKCRAHHELVRQGGIAGKDKPMADQVDSMISYKCFKCNHNEKLHVDNMLQSRPINYFSLSLTDCINHMKGAIENILHECSLPGHSINIKMYLELLDAALDYQHKDLFQAMLKCY